MEYQLQMDLEAVRFLLSLRVPDIARLLKWLDLLKTQPFLQGHSIMRDDTGRDVHIRKTHRFLVYYWTDHPVKTVRIVKIESTRL